jgi:glycerol-3-phosphate cytidylyltransferase
MGDAEVRTVITYGTFDLFHVGHLNLLKRARDLGDRLIVALSTDEFNLEMKDKVTAIPYHNRKAILEELRCVDLVIPEYSWDQKVDDAVKHQVNVFVIGNDWEGKFDFLTPYCEVVYLPRTDVVSSTAIKRHIAHGHKFQIGATVVGQ